MGDSERNGVLANRIIEVIIKTSGWLLLEFIGKLKFVGREMIRLNLEHVLGSVDNELGKGKDR